MRFELAALEDRTLFRSIILVVFELLGWPSVFRRETVIFLSLAGMGCFLLLGGMELGN